MKDNTKPSAPQIENIGEARAKIPVEIGVRFLKQFSEQLYSSPQKAFEELISNGWDAGASRVDVRISPDIKTNANATMGVMDNGVSMDEAGLRELSGHVAFSPKEGKTSETGRPLIGKFGIGKLATYVLANKLTYICKAADGKIRRVTMDYAAIDLNVGHNGDGKLVKDIQLDVFEVTEAEIEAALASVYGGTEFLQLMKGKALSSAVPVSEDEYGGIKDSLQRDEDKTWTLAVLSGLKKPGKELKVGVLKRMLAAALPFGTEMVITVNDATLVSSKLDVPRLKEWVIGPDLGIDSVEMDIPDPADDTKAQKEKVSISMPVTPMPHVNIPGLGIVTGRVVLFADPVTGGKSEERGASNGFHVNVLGRLVNQDSPTFRRAA